MKFLIIALLSLILTSSIVRSQTVEELYNRGNYNISKSLFQDAIKNFDEALAVDSSYYKAYHGKATAELSLSMFKEAIKDYSQAIKFKFNYGEAFYARGIAKLAIGDSDGACRDFHQAHDFNIKEAMDMMDQYCR